MIEEAGLSLDDVPKTWDEWWGWWCETAQPAVREATGDRQKYGVGQPMSSAASDTVFAYMMFLNAFDTKLVDEEGNLLVDQPETREGMIKALESYTKPYLDGCVPPGAVNWQDGDNNVNFKNQISFMVPNPSLSIPASEYAEKDRYMNQMVTMEWPDKPDGSPIEYVTSIKTAVIFKDAQNKEAAKEFMRFYLAAGKSRAAARGRARPLVPGRQAHHRHAVLAGDRRPAPDRRGPAVHAAAADRLAALPELQADRHQRRERLRQGRRPRRPRGLVGRGRRG